MPTFTLDTALDDPTTPERGDILVAARTVYVVLDSRPVESLVWPNRWRLQVRVVARNVTGADKEACVIAACDGNPPPQVIHTSRYRPGERPADYFGAQR